MELRCWRCAAVVASQEQACAACGAGVGGGTAVQRRGPGRVDLGALHALGPTRRWLLALSALALVSGLLFYALQRSQVEGMIHQVEKRTPEGYESARDAMYEHRFGMTWAEVIQHDRRVEKLALGVNLGLAAIYFGLVFWARRNPRVAAAIAPIPLVAAVVIDRALVPRTLTLVPIKSMFLVPLFLVSLFVVPLVRAITTALREPAPP